MMMTPKDLQSPRAISALPGKKKSNKLTKPSTKMVCDIHHSRNCAIRFRLSSCFLQMEEMTKKYSENIGLVLTGE